ASPESRLVVEPFPGGRMYEDRGAGKGYLWAHVVQIVPPTTFDFACDLFPDWGGPARSHVSMQLADVGGRTRLSLTDSIFGCVPSTLEKALDGGWKMLIGQMLKAHAEGRPVG